MAYPSIAHRRQSSPGLASEGDLPQGFRTTNYVRDWLPIRREQCAKHVSRKSRWSQSSARRIASPVSVVAKRHEISEQTIYTWRKRFGGFQANDVRRLKQLETRHQRWLGASIVTIWSTGAYAALSSSRPPSLRSAQIAGALRLSSLIRCSSSPARDCQ
jgi:putative transposase